MEKLVKIRKIRKIFEGRKEVSGTKTVRTLGWEIKYEKLIRKIIQRGVRSKENKNINSREEKKNWRIVG